ncbi:MAG: AAA family ATPase [Candidatus Paceibacteria bacterium]
MSPSILIVVAVLVFITAVYYYLKESGKLKSGSDGVNEYSENVTQLARDGELEAFRGRQEELKRMIRILMRKTKNNPLLLGEAGVGKSAIVHGLAKKIVNEEVPEDLQDAVVLEIELYTLLSGTKYRGEFESRLQKLMDTIRDPESKIIMFIDEIHLIEKMGTSEGALSITDVLKPQLAGTNMQLIGATTWKEYQEFIKPNEPLDRRFQPILVEEPDEKQAREILLGIKEEYENFHGVDITDDAAKKAVKLAHEEIEIRNLPDSAIDLIDEAATKVSIDAEREHHLAGGIVHAAAKDKNQDEDDRERQNAAEVAVDDIQEVVDHWHPVKSEGEQSQENG